MSQLRILVVGAGGQLGASVVHECSPAHAVTAFTHAQLDVTDDGAVADAIAQARPDAVVNAAAFTNVDAAEDHPVEALNVNAFAVRAIARACRRSRAALIHFSTDFVFDGRGTRPYRETDRTNPRSVYAASKLLGEWFAEDVDRAYVLRVESLFGGAPGGPAPRGSVATIVSALVAGRAPTVFEDRTISPTYIPDAAAAARRLLEMRAAPGVYHCVNSGLCTWLEFAQEAARALGVEARFNPVRMSDVTLRAERPLYCALSNEKLRSAGIKMGPWQEALARFVQARHTRS